MIPEILWWVAAVLTFVGTVLIALGAAYRPEWPGRAFDFVGMMIAAWGLALTMVLVLIMSASAAIT